MLTGSGLYQRKWLLKQGSSPPAGSIEQRRLQSIMSTLLSAALSILSGFVTAWLMRS